MLSFAREAFKQVGEYKKKVTFLEIFRLMFFNQI